MTTGVERIGSYVMNVLDYAAANECCISEVQFTAMELLNVAERATYEPECETAIIGAGLAGLHPKTLLCESQLAEILGHDPRTIRSMVSRRELPAPIDFGNKKVWFAGRVVDFLDERMNRAEQDAFRKNEKRSNFRGGAA